jgi:putative FmdB family regulatory protein
MPTYEYECARCGAFEAFRPAKEYREPQPCPDCGSPAPRVVLSAVAVSDMPAAARKAHAVNERSAHAPKTSAQLRHGRGCSCCGNGKNNTAGAASENTSFPNKRPWMISH